jgi:enoyl-[acyl-carrier protein] reductase I
MDFLQLSGKTIVVFGVANKKSIAWHIGKTLEEHGCRVLYVVRSEARKESLAKLMGDREVFVCDVEFPEQIEAVRDHIGSKGIQLAGLVHSIAFAAYDESGMKPFHETGKMQFLRTVDISCYSLIALSNAFKDLLAEDASVVTISISTTRMASESYGFMAPVKAALDSSLAFLAKSFSRFSSVRFNAVAPGLLKTSASAGIPGYVDAYLFAEQVIPRGKAITTQEAANAACFLLSPRSSGINAQQIVIDAGMSINYFDQQIVSRVMNADSAEPSPTKSAKG